jgi:hypothetical protein
MSENELEPDDAVVSRAQEVLALSQSGQIVGICCVCFLANGQMTIQVAGEQNLLVRLGSLVVAADALKMLETQQQVQRQAAREWAPGGNA